MPPTNRWHIEQRRADVARLLLERRSIREVARACGVSHGTAAKDINAVREEWRERRFTDVDAWVAEELARLDVALAAIWPKIVKGDTWSIDRMLAILDRRAKYLGLDAPNKQPVNEIGISEQTVRVIYDDPIPLPRRAVTITASGPTAGYLGSQAV